MREDEEENAHGPVYRHTAPVGEPELAIGDGDLIEDLSRHIEEHVGPISMVHHELISPYVHVDVHHVEPTPERPWHVLVTTGMSSRPMTTPEGVPDDCRHAELVVSLPADWEVSEASFKDERNYWPVRLLKFLARLPHEYGTWLGSAHSIPNGDPAEPYAPDTQLSGVMLLPSVTLPAEFHELERPDNATVRFWSLYPLYPEEMNLKLRKGAEVILEHFERAGITDVIDKGRPNVAAKKSWWPF